VTNGRHTGHADSIAKSSVPVGATAKRSRLHSTPAAFNGLTPNDRGCHRNRRARTASLSSSLMSLLPHMMMFEIGSQ
jgi:hypothetical protein